MKTIRFLDDDSRTPVSLDVTDELAAAIERAAMVNRGKDEIPISFSSLFIGLLATRDATARWLESQFETSGANLAGLMKRRDLANESLEKLRGTADPGISLDQPLRRTVSARSALTEAQRLARDLRSTVDTRHVLAAYISLPTYHDDDFRDLSIDRHQWAIAFSQEMKTRYPNEAPFWDSFVSRVFPQSKIAVELTDKNLEPHVADALKLAAQRAGDQPVTALHVIQAVLSLPDNLGSSAFKRLAEISPLPKPSPVSITTQSLPKMERFDPEFSRQLAFALQPAAGESAPRVWGRDLVTAALLCNDPDLAAALNAVSQPIDLVRDRWFAFITTNPQRRSRSEWVSWWTRAGVPVPGPRRSGYSTETDEGDDKLGVEVEARAFARLILDRDIQPPLSIGLLGDWGSGKSFFIEQIKKQIKALKDEQHPELFGNVVEIEFNAWHASDANLWASLVTNIFDRIWEEVGIQNPSPEEARQLLVKQIEQARGAVHEAEGQVQLAQAALATAEKELKERKETLALNKYVSKKSIKKLSQLAKDAGWHESIETIKDVDSAIQSLAGSSNRLRLVVASLLERPIMNIGLPAVALAVLAVGIWLLVDQYGSSEWIKGFTKWATASIGSIGAIVTPLRLASRKVGQLADRLTSIRDEYEGEVKSAAAPAEAEKLRVARREFESAEASVKAAKTRLAELLNEQALLDPRRRLGTFLQDRVQSTVYRSQQGIISLVHKDFRELSKYMKDLRDHPSQAPSQGPGIKPLERIVLYVDDLDRCRPDHVVNMLEAVHLLLALDLFVVVVAVDSRWLTRALELHYKDLLDTNGDRDNDGLRASTPQNYLEKIFQVTYALGPMDPNHFKEYVAFLAGADKKAPPPTTGQPAGTGGRTEPPKSTGTKTGDGEPKSGAQGASKDREQAQGKAAESKQPAAAKPAMPPPHAVRIDKDEQEVIWTLSPLLPTPRVAKRLINVYRLIKASKNIDALEEFNLTKRANTNLLMLAILFGCPGVASYLLRELYEREAPFDNPQELFRDAIRKRMARQGEPKHLQEEWGWLTETLDHMKVAATVDECAREPLEIARYSLASGDDWHTWKKPASANGTKASAREAHPI